MKHKNDYIFTENQFVCLDFAFVKVWRILFIADTANTSDILFLYIGFLSGKYSVNKLAAIRAIFVYVCTDIKANSISSHFNTRRLIY
jgi:hypothetical protein